MHIRKIIPFILVIMSLPFAMSAQVTTSSISGFTKAGTGSGLAGATVTATHIPTGTVYTAIARTGGRFDINNMNPGGPYRITTTFTGFEAVTKEDVFLTLGETYRTDFDLRSKETELATVVVTGGRRVTTAKTGTETSISRAKLDVIPNIGRNISDYLRFTPQARINGQSISIGGQNNRYNSFLIDGAVNNDVFGLSTSGTNGGRAGTPPISIDAIDQLVVSVAPYDASFGNFTGGAINAVTKSGTNQFHGSAYYVFRNQNLAGLTPGVPDSVSVKYPKFKNKTYGFTIGGPILKNKAFFFLNAEKQRDERPQPYTGPEGAVIDSINKLVNHLKTKYNYDPGDFRNNADLIDRININTRFDFNVTKAHKLTLSYRYTDVERINPNRSSYNGSFGTINFTNGAEVFPSISHSGNLELNSKFSNKLNNKFRVSFTDVVDDRQISGTPFPAVTLNSFNGGPSFNFGSEAPSTANLLEQSIINFYNALKFNTGKHAFTLGADLDFNKSYNLFINRNFGQYIYATLGPNQPNVVPQIGSLQAFIEDRGPSRLQRQYSLVDPGNKSGDEGGVNAAANFKSVRLGFFLNDEIKVTSKFTLTLGLRADRTAFTTTPPTDEFFRDSAMPVINQFYDLRGAKSGEKFKPSFLFSPRLGFKYNIDEENVTLRGGIGIFGGRTPLVWPGGIYQNTGTVIGALDTARTTGQLLAAGTGSNPAFGLQTVTPGSPNQPIRFNPNVNTQFTQADFGLPANLIKSQGDINLISNKFKLPAVIKTSLAADKRFGNGWTFTTEFLFTKNIYEADWQNVNFLPQTGLKSTGPDTRDIYSTTGNPTRLTYRPGGATALIRNPYSNIILIKNTEGKKGYSYNFTVQLNKESRKGLQLNAAYTYGNSQVNNEGTSSVNVSNWQFMETVRGRNNNVRSISDFDLGHRIYALISKKFTYANQHAATTLTLSYNGQSGSTYSYVYSGGFVGDGVFGNDLMYIPASRAEMDAMVFVTRLFGAAATPAANAANIAQQKDEFEAFIQNDKYLRRNRGRHAERNGARLPFTNILDANISQEFLMKIGQTTHKASVTLDVFNLTNLISKKAGKIYFVSFDQANVVSFRGYQTGTTTPTFQFFKPRNNVPYQLNDVQTSANTSARWNAQLTFRYSF